VASRKKDVFFPEVKRSQQFAGLEGEVEMNISVDTLRFCSPIMLLALVKCSSEIPLAEVVDSVANNEISQNEPGYSASFSTQGEVNLEDEFFVPQGTNGRHCGTCHLADDGWSIRPSTAQLFFDETGGLHPLFNLIDADRPDPLQDLSTVEARRQAYTMLLQGKFTRRVSVPGTAEYQVIAVDDPFGVGTTTSLWFFRRPLPSANFRSHTVMWDAANTVGVDLHAGLVRQARGNVTGAQQGPPASDEVINTIVAFELALSHAQLLITTVGRLDAGDARGGPEHHAAQALVAGPFDIYDAWTNDGSPYRQQIARGQALFNDLNVPSGRRCGACHNAANNGQNVNGTLFNIGTSDAQWAGSDMAIYTLQNIATGEIKQSTDPGRGIRTGLWNDVNRFKTPNLRGLASRAPFFHNGIAATLEEVIDFYEASLGFDFTEQEEADLVAFLTAL
jgi:cytochrome c peroxidase